METEFSSSYASVVHNDGLISLYEKYAREYGVEIKNNDTSAGSSDFGDVSHVVPGIHPMFSITDSANVHSCEFTSAAGL